MRNPQTPLSPGEEDALDQLKAYFERVGDDEFITRAIAVRYLVSNGLEQSNANDYIQQLVLKGYLYEVGEELRVLPRSR